MQHYLNLCQRVANTGKWVKNERTGKRCLTVINADFEYDVSEGKLPILTTKKTAWKPAIAEFLGYLRGYTSAKQFRDLGTKTWDANANDNAAWLKNKFRTGEDHIGRAYGAQARSWVTPEGAKIDQLKKVIDNLSKGIDDRREIITFWNPGEMDRMCLAPCMHTHTFSILEDELYLTSYQRSDDLPLGHAFNQIQVAWFLMVVAQIAKLKPKTVYHKVINAHIYEDQIDLMVNEQLKREPYPLPTMKINPDIKSLEDLETWVTMDDFELVDYIHHPAIKYPFSV